MIRVISLVGGQKVAFRASLLSAPSNRNTPASALRGSKPAFINELNIGTGFFRDLIVFKLIHFTHKHKYYLFIYQYLKETEKKKENATGSVQFQHPANVPQSKALLQC